MQLMHNNFHGNVSRTQNIIGLQKYAICDTCILIDASLILFFIFTYDF